MSSRVVLVVDDEESFRSLCAAQLRRRLDVEVLVAADAEAALDRLRGADVDCVVADYEMPGPDGVEFLRTIRTAHPDLPVLVLTGKGSEDVASEAFRAGATDYLRKRADSTVFEVLARRVERAVAEAAARREARRARTRFQAAIDALDDVLYVLDEDGRFELWNDALTEVTGYGDDEVREADPTDLFVPEDRDRVAEAVARVLDGESVTVEVRVLTAEGRRVPYELTGARLATDDGESLGVCGVGRDVSTRRRLERELDAVLDRVTDAFVGLDRDLRFAYVNDRAAELLGREPDALLGERVVDALPFARRTKAYGEVVRAMETRTEVDVEEYVPELDAWFELTAYPDATGVSVYFREVDDDRRPSGDVRVALDRVTDAFLALDDEWRFTYINGRGEELVGLTREEALGEVLWDCFPDAVGTRFEDEYRRAVETGEPVSFREYYPPLGTGFDVRAYPSANGLSVYFREWDGDTDGAVGRDADAERGFGSDSDPAPGPGPGSGSDPGSDPGSGSGRDPGTDPDSGDGWSGDGPR
jgi:PAS domain S-box-containing protein